MFNDHMASRLVKAGEREFSWTKVCQQSRRLMQSSVAL